MQATWRAHREGIEELSGRGSGKEERLVGSYCGRFANWLYDDGHMFIDENLVGLDNGQGLRRRRQSSVELHEFEGEIALIG